MKNIKHPHRPRTRAIGVRGLITAMLAGAATFAHAGTEYSVSTTDLEVQEESAFSDWWNGKQMLSFLPGRDLLEEHGIKLNGKWRGAFYGVLQSENGQKGFFDQEVAFSTDVDFAKLFNSDALEGLSGFAGVRWRQPESGQTPGPNEYVEAASLFNPSHFQSGTQWRLLTFGLKYATPEVFGIKDFITVKGGWLQPQKEFIDQPLSKLFLNNAIESSKGVGGNIPFSSSFSTWGGTLQVKPTGISYVKGGIFMSFPSATSSANHGLAFQGYGPDTSRNGLMFMGEAGIKPKFGSAELPGHYAFGGYWWGQDNTSYYGASYEGQYGFYGQADQMLFRESSPQPEPEEVVYAKGASDGKSMSSKSFKEPVPMTEPKLSDQGLYSFNLVSFAPKYNNKYPFYFQTGLVYKGLIPTRDKDQTMLAVAAGQYSFYQIEALQAAGNVNQPNFTLVVEGGYRVQINGWAFTQPFVQYIAKPNGTEAVENAWVLGLLTGVDF